MTAFETARASAHDGAHVAARVASCGVIPSVVAPVGQEASVATVGHGARRDGGDGVLATDTIGQNGRPRNRHKSCCNNELLPGGGACVRAREIREGGVPSALSAGESCAHPEDAHAPDAFEASRVRRPLGDASFEVDS